MESDNKNNEEITILMANLKVLSKVKKNQKCKIINNMLVIDNNNIFDNIKRSVSGASRYKTLEKIKELIKSSTNIIKICEENINNKAKPKLYDDFSSKDFEHAKYLKNWSVKAGEMGLTNETLLMSIVTLLKEASVGIKELKNTYMTDITYVSELDVNIEMIDRIIKEYGNIKV